MSRYEMTWLAAFGVALAAACGAADTELEDDHDETELADVVELDSLQAAATDLEVGVAGSLPPDTIDLTGSFTFVPTRVSHIGPRMEGRISRVKVEVGDEVKAGQTLAILDSPELSAAQAAWFRSAVVRDVNRRNYERVERLFTTGIISERRRLEAEGELRKSESELAAAERTLSAHGAEPDSAASGLFVLRSPLSGVVVDKHATIGEVVGPDAILFTVGDPNLLWIILDVYEADLSRVRVGAPVVLTTEAYPGRSFDGRTAYVAAVVDTTSRTVKVRVEIPNPGRVLKPGMFARARLVLADDAPLLGVPEAAIQTVGGVSAVFRPEGERRYRVQPVVIGRTRAGGWVEVLDGLSPGDSVVVRGSFALKSELERESFGEGHD